MLKETRTAETIVFFVTFLSLVAFQLGGGAAPLLGYAYGIKYNLLVCLSLAKGVSKARERQIHF